MAALGRRERATNIWPGFVDALATLLLVIIFLLLIFVLAQFFLGEALSGRDSALDRLRGQVSELADLLALERRAQKNLKTNLAQMSAELQTSVAMRDDLRSTINAMRLKAEDTEAQLGARLAAAEAAGERGRQALAASEEKLRSQLSEMAGLNRDIAALRALREELEAKIAELAENAARADQSLAASRKELSEKDETLAAQRETLAANKKTLLEEKQLSKSARAEVALLNKQMATLRAQLAKIDAALQASEKMTAEQKVQIVNLGKRLNAALASKVQELSRYRSEFFGRLRDVLGRQPGLRIVGDRFVFQSEVLFDKGSATIGEAGQHQLTALAATLKTIASKIPEDIDWVLRVDGHTDSDPIRTLRFPSNWELSSARAIAVVQRLIAEGLPANRLVAAGFGEYQPIEVGHDEIAKRRNRRIELKLTRR